MRGYTLTKIPALGAAMVTAAFADLVGSATLVAVTVTIDGVGTDTGAMYCPVVPMVPTVELPPGVPFTLQFTDWFTLPVTMALNCIT